MIQPVPPLHAIMALLTAARTTSFREAAAQLALTPSAFSRRIQLLENYLGVELYDRSGPTPRLTPSGIRYCQALEPAVQAICGATHSLRSAPPCSRLRLMCPPSLAMNWLMSRLRTYNEQHGEPEVDLVVTRDLDTLRLGGADLAIASGPRDFEGLPSEPFLSLKGAVVAAPRLSGGRPLPRSPADLHQHRLLGLSPPADLPRDLWSGWRDRTQYAGPALGEPMRFDTWALMYEAAANGMGVTIAVPAVAENYLREGRLRPCFGGSVELDVQYKILHANNAVRRHTSVRRLVAWLRSEIAASVASYYSLVNAGA